VPFGVRLLLVLVALLAGVPRAARAQDLSCGPGDREVRTLRFAGNRAFTDRELESVVVTTPSSALSRLRFVGTRRCLEPEEFPRDLLRLVAFYRKRGYPQAAVDTAVREREPRVLDVTFVLREGRPLVVDTLVVQGLAGVRDSGAIVRDFPLRRGGVFDRVALEAARDTIVRRLRNAGYPAAQTLLEWSTDLRRLTANATVTVVPGAFARLGAIAVRPDSSDGRPPRIPERVVRRTLGLRPGDPFRADDILEAQRTLYQTDAYRRVEVRVDSSSVVGDSLVNLEVVVAEGDQNSARVSAGWATLDCFRTQGTFSDRYFLPRAQRLELSASVSKIGIGEPLGGADWLCRQAKPDPFSRYLNYYAGATVRQPSLFRLRRVPSVTVFTSRASEYKAYLRTVNIGTLLSLVSRPGSRLPSTATYQFELGRTEAEPAVLCAVFNACTTVERAALRNDQNAALGAVGYSIARLGTDNAIAPQTGTVLRLTARHASAATGSAPSQRFNRVLAEAVWYRPVGDASLVARTQYGALFGSQPPPQERLFAGGPTTVRGFRQNELGPAVYLVGTPELVTAPTRADTSFEVAPGTRSAERTVPTGGNRMVMGSLEAQLRSPLLPELLQFAVFTDVGQVWNQGREPFRVKDLKWTPGAGLRVRSAFGVIRLDLGYNGYPVPDGAAYYNPRPNNRNEAPLFCVSPGNGIPVTGAANLDQPDRPAPQQPPNASCPSSFAPTTARGFFQRLNPSIWIGQAF
jgi:outer membrane protein insertion porin family/translocation and assembly module TamA